MSWNLFLSSTFHDFKPYRTAVKAVCQAKVGVACQLNEDGWPGGYDDTVTKCMKRVTEADCFILLAGYWYGSVPPGGDRSITHLEFDQALRKWNGQSFPAMGVMMPEPGSRAFRDLSDRAERVLGDQPPTFDRSEHHRRLANFHAALTGSWRTVRRFRDKADLREWAITDIKTWMGGGRTFLDTAAAMIALPAAGTRTELSDEQLGQLGREDQFAAIRTALATACARPGMPALAFHVRGAPDAGLSYFLKALPGRALKGAGSRPGLGRFSGDPADLPGWVARLLKLASSGPVDSVEHLAGAVAAALRERPLYFMLDRIGDLPGGAAAFEDQFWRPLQQALCFMQGAQPFTNRLVAVVGEHEPLPDAGLDGSTAAPPGASPPDYSRLLSVPRLGNFSEADLYLWLEEQEVPDHPPGRRANLVARAMKHSGGSPLLVFDFLGGEPLWPDGDFP